MDLKEGSHVPSPTFHTFGATSSLGVSDAQFLPALTKIHGKHFSSYHSKVNLLLLRSSH